MMLKSDERRAIFTLRKRGLSNREIASTMGIHRDTVATVLSSGRADPEVREGLPIEALQAHPQLEHLVRDLHRRCEGYVTRIVECLEQEQKIIIPYSTMARYVNWLKLRRETERSGPTREISTAPGEEMQHDTSPITVLLGKEHVGLHLAELVCCFSRNRYIEFFPKWKRFHTKVFFTHALAFLGGACGICVVDNAKVIVILGAGPGGVLSPEMERFAKGFDFEWQAIFPGHKNRNGKVEKCHQFVQTNFLPGRSFRDLADLNTQLAEWRDGVFKRPVDGQDFAPVDRWPAEQANLKRLPSYLPVVSQTWSGKRVDDYGWVRLNNSQYSAPDRYVRRFVTVRETFDEIILLDRSQELCRHPRYPEHVRGHSRLPGHQAAQSRKAPRRGQSSEEIHLRSLGPVLAGYLDDLAARPIRYSYARLRRLYRFSCDYPQEIFLSTIQDAHQRRGFDLNQIERVLEEKIGHQIMEGRLQSDTDLELRPAYRQGQVTPHQLRESPSSTVPDAAGNESRDTLSQNTPQVEGERRDPDGNSTRRTSGDSGAAENDLQPGRSTERPEGGTKQTEELHVPPPGTTGAGGGGA
jgi:transposase